VSEGSAITGSKKGRNFTIKYTDVNCAVHKEALHVKMLKLNHALERKVKFMYKYLRIVINSFVSCYDVSK
jgi:hypothetical protein